MLVMRPVSLSMPHSAVATQFPPIKTDRDNDHMIATLRLGAHTHIAHMTHTWHTDHTCCAHADGRRHKEMADGKHIDGTNTQLAHPLRIEVRTDGKVRSHTF